eukprot:sb/3470104/
MIMVLIASNVYRKNKQLLVRWREGSITEPTEVPHDRTERLGIVLETCNKASLLFAVLTSVGTLAVGAFQIRNTFSLHLLALALMGLPGYVFFVLQTFLSRQVLVAVLPPHRVRRIFITRIVVLSISVGLISVFFILATAARYTWANETGRPMRELDKWTSREPGFSLFASSNFFQWAWMAANFCLVYSLRIELSVIVSPVSRSASLQTVDRL